MRPLKISLFRVAAACTAVILQFPAPSCAADARDGIAVEAGYGQHTDLARIDLTREWDARWYADRPWVLTGYWEGSYAHWRPHNPIGGNQDVNDFGITPVWRVVQQQRGTIAPFAELAVGAHYLSNHEPWHGHQMSTHFQFGDHVALGASLGAEHAVDLALRFQHLSNAGIENPNPGINFIQLRADYHF